MKRREFLGAAAAAAVQPARAQQGRKTVVVGDVHGDPERFVDVLSMAGLIDGSKAWSGGNSVLVQLGDMVDRGPDPKTAIELLQKLEKEAKKAKGKVYGLIGNHEAMRMYGDLRYVPAGEYEAFKTKKSEQEREKRYMRETSASDSASDIKSRPDLTLGYRQKWEKEHPLGQIELMREYGTEGKLGKWALGQKAVLVLDGTLYVHAGLSPKYLSWSEGRINDAVTSELMDVKAPPADGAVRGDDGPLWYRGLAQLPEEEIAAHVDAVLEKFQVKRIIVGHTPQRQGVVSRLKGKVLLADVGLAKVFGGAMACVVIENGEAYALQDGKKKELS